MPIKRRRRNTGTLSQRNAQPGCNFEIKALALNAMVVGGQSGQNHRASPGWLYVSGAGDCRDPDNRA
jgi:hypothetical protein